MSRTVRPKPFDPRRCFRQGVHLAERDGYFAGGYFADGYFADGYFAGGDPARGLPGALPCVLPCVLLGAWSLSSPAAVSTAVTAFVA